MGLAASTIREPQVEYADGTRIIEHQISRLDIAMNDSRGVGRFEAASRLNDVVNGRDDRQRAG